MNKKLILLMLALPLILMISLFTATSTVSLTVKVPVERIEIRAENVVYLDLDDGDTYLVDYTVYPTNAANKEVTFSTQKVGDEPLAELQFENGALTPKTCGKARVFLTTNDGGFSDSFVVQVDSKSLSEIRSRVRSAAIEIGEGVEIVTEFIPANAPNKQLRYEVTEGAENVSVDSRGVITGLGVGTATVKILSRFNESIFDEVTVEVKSPTAMQFIPAEVTNTMQQTGGSIPLYVEENVEFTYELEVLSDGVATDEAIEYTVDVDNKVFLYTFKDWAGSVELILTVYEEGKDPFVDTCTLTRISSLQASWIGASSIAVPVGMTRYVYFKVAPGNIQFEYEISYEHNDGGYITVTEDIENKQLIILAEKADDVLANSYAVVILRIWEADKPEEAVELRLTVNVYVKG